MLATGCFYLEEGVCARLLAARSRCTFERVPGHVDSGVCCVCLPARRRRRRRRRCDGRWECLVKPANCYRFIGTAGTCREKKERRIAERSSVTRGRSSVRPSVFGRLWCRTRISGVSDYGNSSCPFVISYACTHTVSAQTPNELAMSTCA